MQGEVSKAPGVPGHAWKATGRGAEEGVGSDVTRSVITVVRNRLMVFVLGTAPASKTMPEKEEAASFDRSREAVRCTFVETPKSVGPAPFFYAHFLGCVDLVQVDM